MTSAWKSQLGEYYEARGSDAEDAEFRNVNEILSTFLATATGIPAMVTAANVTITYSGRIPW